MSLQWQVLLAMTLCAVISYLLGSISFAVIFTKIFAKTDVREHGSGNAGMTNVFRTAGKLPGILTLILDTLKAIVAVAIGKYGAMEVLCYTSGGRSDALLDPLYMAYICGFCCLLGHMFPIFFGFRGGKGVLTSLGTIMMVDWSVGLVALAAFLLVFLLFRIVSLGSIVAAVTLPFSTYFLYPLTHQGVGYRFALFGMSQKLTLTIFSAVIMIIVLANHRSNIKRLIHGEEKPIHSKR